MVLPVVPMAGLETGLDVVLVGLEIAGVLGLVMTSGLKIVTLQNYMKNSILSS
jgi:hypothetical protein